MKSTNTSVQELRRELRSAIGDRGRLMKLNTVVTNIINDENTYGEEKTILLKFRQEIKEVLSCRML